MTGWPNFSESGWLTSLAVMSVPPPGGNGTMMRTGLVGQASAPAARGACTSAAISPKAILLRRRLFEIRPLLGADVGGVELPGLGDGDLLQGAAALAVAQR